ncbi:hypothetical protein [Martelella mediterranea]|uniref:Two-component system cell cycle response regulator n=1 Tax=Martelella mediterranea TaxID=293089 RepID=A0A4R3NKP5_9HYPH|nr:hypothetical protein [Martelella mediterranea]TCT35501.1 two-component system cell cycle response regulator [Martelella mediterranea]
MRTEPDESIVLIGGEGPIALTLKTLLGNWPVAFHQADFSDGDGTMAAVQSANVILVAIEDDPAPALACCGILKEPDSGVSAPIALVTAEPVDAALRLAALRSGADDIIGLDQNISIASARLSSLLRLRTLQVEAGNGAELGENPPVAELLPDETVRVLVVAEAAAERRSLLKAMLSLTATVATGDVTEALYRAARENFDLVLVHGADGLSDALRICRQVRCISHMRFVPLIAMTGRGGSLAVSGEAVRNADDCMTWDGEANELVLRSLLHLRRRRLLAALGEADAGLQENAEVGERSGLPAREAFAAALKTLRGEADEAGHPLYMGVFQIGEMVSEEDIEIAGSLIRSHLVGREIASRIEDGVFAVLFPDRGEEAARASLTQMKSQLEENHALPALTGNNALHASSLKKVKTVLVDAARSDFA